jgi:uncharacterized protein
MNKHKLNARISRSLLIAWAVLLVFVVGLLTWVALAPNPELPVSEEVSTSVDLQLPEAMPVDKYILKDKETKDDTGGSASATQLENKTQLADGHHEMTKHGAIPQVGKDGKSAPQLYAAQAAPPTEGKIKVAFIFTDLGRNDALLDKIIEHTPAGVTLAYLPHTSELKTKIKTAREKGHEILLNVPMEPADYPNTDTGPNTLLTGLATADNLDRLHWTMAQGDEYIGLMNMQGSLFLASSKDLNPVLQDAHSRGLLFVEAEACFRSQAEEAAKNLQLPYMKSQFVLNESLTPAELQATLIRAEQMAQESGFISIVAHSSPLTTPTLLTWIKRAQEQDYVFLPVSQIAFAHAPKSEAPS